MWFVVPVAANGAAPSAIWMMKWVLLYVKGVSGRCGSSGCCGIAVWVLLYMKGVDVVCCTGSS